MKRFLSLLLVTAAVCMVGCGKRKNKVAQIQKDTVSEQFVEQERSAKEDYSIVA